MGDSGSMLARADALGGRGDGDRGSGARSRFDSSGEPAAAGPATARARRRAPSSRSSTYVLAVIRRTRKGQSPFSPGQDAPAPPATTRSGTRTDGPCSSCTSGRRCSRFGAVALSITGGRAELLIVIAVLLVVGVVVVLSPRARRAAREARAAELVAQRERSRAEHPTARAVRRTRSGRRRRRGRPGTGAHSAHGRAGATGDRAPGHPDPEHRSVGHLVPAGRGARHRGRRRWWPHRSPGCSGAGASAATASVAGSPRRDRFFCVSGVVIARAGRIDDSLTLPAALGTFMVKLLVLVAVLEPSPGGRVAGPARSRLDRHRRRPCCGAWSRAAGCGPGSCST